MSSSSSTSTDQHSLDVILQNLKAKNVRDAHDVLFLTLHAFMLSAGFRLVGLGDDGNLIGAQ
jgi:hypothetical protein